jgi:hypothetical protein
MRGPEAVDQVSGTTPYKLQMSQLARSDTSPSMSSSPPYEFLTGPKSYYVT